MYAVVRDNTFDSTKLEAGGTKLAEFQAAHAAQNGYQGSIVVDIGSGRQITLTLWRSEAEAEAARVALGPVIGRTVVPLLAKSSVLVGVGEVLFDDLSKSG
jgi:hypothetical protein